MLLGLALQRSSAVALCRAVLLAVFVALARWSLLSDPDVTHPRDLPMLLELCKAAVRAVFLSRAVLPEVCSGLAY